MITLFFLKKKQNNGKHKIDIIITSRREARRQIEEVISILQIGRSKFMLLLLLFFGLGGEFERIHYITKNK